MGIILDADKNTEFIQAARANSHEEDVSYVPEEHMLDDVYIHEKELELLKEKYSRSVVQDFGDMYHMSNEEKEKNKIKYEKIYKLRNMRAKCPKLSEYVKEWRLVLDIIKDIAKNNKIIDEDDFIKKALQKKIKINGVTFPTYVGKRKNNINWSFIIDDYILSKDKDPEELNNLAYNPLDLDSDDLDEETLLDDPMIREIVESCKEEDEDEIIEIIERQEYDKGAIAGEIGYSNKKLRKLYPELFRGMKDMRKVEEKLKRISGFGAEIEDDDWDYLSRYDERYRKKDSDIPKFKGSWDNQADIDDYVGRLTEYEESLEYVKYNGRYYTQDEINEIELKEFLEHNGWNIRNCFIDKAAEKALKKQRKEDKKKEKKIKEMLAAIQNRKDSVDAKLNGLPQGINIEEAKRKLKKSKKKGKKKSKAEKKSKKMTDIILDADRDPEYRDKMEDFRWDL